MASGLLGQSALVGATTTTVYTVPASKLGVLNINIVNRDTTNAATVRVALTTAASVTEPLDAEYIEFGAEIPAKGVLERTGIALDAAKNVVVYDAQGTCSVSVYGLEQSA
tara:strand:- start:1776 stop:2105 length:330 start_codon:yes stop_codon:yes gene_type:complete